MVGVPGRSKACKACKQRRVACGLEQPACSRCIKAKRQCTYGNGHIFVVNDEGSHKTIYRKKAEVPVSSEDRNLAHAVNGSTPHDVEREGFKPLADAVVQGLLLYKSPEASALRRQSLLANALEGDLVYSTPTFGTLASSCNNGLMQESLQAPFLACYFSWIGRRQQEQRLIDASREFYIRALKETHMSLILPETVYADTTLAACNALGIYEALECPDGTMTAYYWHRAASYRMIRMRGPAVHQDGFAHRLFTNFRFFGILHAFDSGHATFLAEPEWTSIPFSVHPKTKFDELLDIFALGPETSALGRSIPSLPQEKALPTAFQILSKLSVIKRKLQTFYCQLEESYPGPLYWERTSPPSNSVTGKSSDFVFPPCLWFANLDIANMMTLYWAILAMVWSGLADLHSMFTEYRVEYLFTAAAGESNELTPEAMRFMFIDRSRKVLQSLAFCTTDEAMAAGPPRGTTQLAIVIDVMKNRKGCEAECRWALKARKRMGAKWLRVLSALDKD